MKSELKYTHELRHVTVRMKPEFNVLLEDSAYRTERAKRREAELRLEDHLRRFSSITELGCVTERN